MKAMFSCVLLFVLTVSAGAQRLPNDLAQLIRSAVESSPAVEMRKAEQTQKNFRIDQHTNLPDPKVAVGLVNLPVNSFSFTQEPMTGKMIGISQSFPFPGKLDAAGNVLRKDADIVKYDVEEIRGSVAMQTAELYWNLALRLVTVEVLREQRELLENVREVTASLYEVSKSPQQDLFATDVNISKMDDRLLELDGRIRSLRAELFTLSVDSSAFTVTPELPDNASAKLRAAQEEDFSSRAFLLQAEALEQKALLEEQSAEYTYYPDFTLSAQYNQRDRLAATGQNLNDFFSFTVGVSIPLNYGGKNDAAVEEARAKQSVYRSLHKSRLQTIEQQFAALREEIASLEKRIVFNRTTLTRQAEEQFAAALQDYQTERAPFASVTSALNSILEIRLDRYSLAADLLAKETRALYLQGRLTSAADIDKNFTGVDQ